MSVAMKIRKTVQSILGELLKRQEVACDIDQLLHKVLARAEFDASDRDECFQEDLKAEIRRGIMQFKDAGRLRLVENVVEIGEDGKPQNRYVQLDLFDEIQAPRLVEKYVRMCRRAGIKANKLAEYFSARGIQMLLPFPEFGTNGDTDEEDDLA